MRTHTIIIILLFLSSLLKSQTDIQIQIPETYELSNIILALTDYGRNDEMEVQKKSKYYKDMIAFFEPVRNHSLLKKVNYSRGLWEDYLSFRTDAIAFSFKENKLKRTLSFNANTGHAPFDKNLALINDFIIKSGFRTFYKNHTPYYDSIIANYSSYYMIDQMMAFLKNEAGSNQNTTKKGEYKIVISPLVGRMNCHINIPGAIVADFPSLAVSLINDPDIAKLNNADRAIEIHTLFSEADHGFVNPISEKFEKEMKVKIDYVKWDNKSGYSDINIFNEYMTWALYDLFVLKYFPDIADSVSTQWHYQNGERGFFASSVFAKKLIELSEAKKDTETLVDLYPKMINWCSEFQNEISLPTIVSPTEPLTIKDFSHVNIEILFSEPMKEKENFDINVISIDPKVQTTALKLTKGKNDIEWGEDGKKLSFTIDLSANKKINLQPNWWGCKTPLESKKGIMLKVFSKVILKQAEQ
jgi:hypothetical protein